MNNQRPRVLIEVSGGVVQSITSDADVDLIFINWDEAGEVDASEAVHSGEVWERIDSAELTARLAGIESELNRLQRLDGVRAAHE